MGALTDKYCIVGVGETPHMRPSNRTTLSMACEAVRNAMADAGLQASDIDGMTSYQVADSTSSAWRIKVSPRCTTFPVSTAPTLSSRPTFWGSISRPL